MPAPQSAQVLVEVARSTLDSHAGRALTEAEWDRMRSRLVRFAATIREWAGRSEKVEPGLGNVDEICQPEP